MRVPAEPVPLAVVTGGAGFIGSHLVRRLAATHRVVVLDDLSTGKAERLPPSVALVRASVLDEATMADAVRGASLVVHLAATTSVPQCQADPEACLRTNALGTLRVLQAAAKARVAKVVFASTCAVYGDASTPPIAEDAPLAPLGPYAQGKLQAEGHLRVVGSVAGLPATALRFFNVYGPGQDPASPYAAVLPRFIDLARKGQPLQLHGGGRQTRDFVNVRDVVEAIVAASRPGAADGEAVNVGSGRPITIRELAGHIVRLTGSSSPLVDAPARPGDVLHSHADVTKARRLLGFEARVRLEDGLAELVATMPPAR